ncbi:uncharacterized protein N7479_002196 [Penicillium vulpinum]|uniref:Uncharacterized protein n=1 Tax=Penicillium vulpinum TaxID=29845 RepID=A0A1V6S848_9EURO|nr:uncharacterized protein N7479_002196 [Penicillium vulpinum]KAJ5972278.1 hypothetical protein N7479_002196 [Penicillium vulpinum]OQE09940.1 hypothetical protein PENVUL_c005G04099 [Penicillium vulpinum]
MAPIFSKFADDEFAPKTPQSATAHDQDLTTKKHATTEGRVPELLNPQAIKTEMEEPEASRSIKVHHYLSSPGSQDWTNEQVGLTMGNGQMRLNIHEWRSASPTIFVENNPKGNPKCDLEVFTTESDVICVEFKMPTDYPDGMLGIIRSIDAIFVTPKNIAMSDIEPGSAPAYRESKNPKRDNYYIKWTAPWETSGCRVSWMKAEEMSPILKFKFVNSRNATPAEQMMVTVDERDEFYQKISNKDPNIYGKWMALPVRIWLHIQRLMSKTGDIDNKLFGKLPVNENYPLFTRRKNKGKKISKKLPKRGRESSTAEEGSSEDGKLNASVVPSPEPPMLEQKDKMETVGSQELIEGESTDEVLTQKELIKKVLTLTIDTQESNRKLKVGKRTPGSFGASGASVASFISGSDIGKKDADQLTDRSDDQGGDLLLGVQDIARKDVLTEQQLAAVAGQQAVNASRFNITPGDLTTPLSPSFETARSHLSPHTPLPSSSLSSFFTPTSTPRKYEDNWGEEVKAEGNEPAEISDQLGLTPRGDEAGLRCPVSNNGGKLWFSDQEEYIGGHKAQELVLRRRKSFDMASLGLFKGQRTTSLSPKANPLLSFCASSDSSTTDSTGFGADDPGSDCTVQPGDQYSVESSKRVEKSAYKKRRIEKRKRRMLQKRQQVRDAKIERPVSDSSSQDDGVEGHSPSPPEASEDEERTPTAKQFDKIGSPSPETQLDLSRVAFLCEKLGCQVLCGFRDGVSVVCPKCGPFSVVRYCGKEHLWEDVKMHWLVCGTQPVQEQHLASLIPYDVLVGPPMLPSLHQWDNPERHRQAVWFSSARDQGDYFVFAEWDDLVKAVDAPASHVELRCSPRIAHIVRFEDAEEKDRFRRCLAVCLFAAVEHPALVDYLYRLVRDWMRAHGMWASDKDMDGMLQYQMGLEMGYTIDKSRLGLRHACETEWVGASRRHCENLTCASERRPTLLGNQCMGLGFRRVCEYLESNYWILRAHRTTHPSVSDVVARTCGGGFSEVLSMDRRSFHRGEGWDGAGTGPMEVEMP